MSKGPGGIVKQLTSKGFRQKKGRTFQGEGRGFLWDLGGAAVCDVGDASDVKWRK